MAEKKQKRKYSAKDKKAYYVGVGVGMGDRYYNYAVDYFEREGVRPSFIRGIQAGEREHINVLKKQDNRIEKAKNKKSAKAKRAQSKVKKKSEDSQPKIGKELADFLYEVWSNPYDN